MSDGTCSGIEFDHLTVSRRRLLLLDELTGRVPQATTLAVMGRSGVGKTSLLRAIAGLTPPAAGHIRRPAGHAPTVFQEPRLLPWRTALNNVELVLPHSQRKRARDWLARVGLEDAVDAYPARLSGGMRQRVAIARAFACDSPLLLVDEPFAHLDVLTSDTLRVELLEQIQRTGRTTVWVTHDPDEAARVATQTLILDGPPQGGWRLVDHGPLSREEVSRALRGQLSNHPTTNTHRKARLDEPPS